VGLEVETHFTGHEFAGQVKQVRECIDGKSRPSAIVVLPVRDRGFAHIKVTGCDATPELGQKLVAGGRMVASISLPHVSGPAIEAIARHLQGIPMPPTLFFKATSFPVEGELKPLG
jgi:ABC-type sugar transport system substrate-binding protein